MYVHFYRAGPRLLLRGVTLIITLDFHLIFTFFWYHNNYVNLRKSFDVGADSKGPDPDLCEVADKENPSNASILQC